MKKVITHWLGAAKTDGADVLRGEAAGRQRRQGVRERVERVHPLVDPEPAEAEQDQGHQGGQADVDQPELACGVANTRRDRLMLGAGKLRLDQLPSSDSKPGQDRDRKDDDPHPAKPLRQLPPHQKAPRQVIDVSEDGRAGRREAGHRLEVGIERTVELRVAGEQIRERADPGDDDPGESDDEIALARPDALLSPRNALQREPGNENDRRGDQKRPGRLAVAERDAAGISGVSARYLVIEPTRSSAEPTST